MISLIKKIAKQFGYSISRIGTEKDFVRWSKDVDFDASYQECHLDSLLNPDRLFMIWQFARQSRTLAGDVAQVGVYQGGSAKLISHALRNSGKSLHLFDTFSGMPEVDDLIDLHKKYDFSDTSLERVKRLFEGSSNTYFYQGVFPNTADLIKNRQFCFIYIDVDIYKSTKDALEFFYPRLVSGGFIIFDDYKGKHTPGVKKAIDEFLVDKKEIPIITTIGQCLFIKQDY